MTSPTSDYTELVRFLVTPFLQTPDRLSIHCETYANGKIWVRIAFDDADKEQVLGRNGRNVQAMRTVVETAGKMAGQSVHLEVFGSPQVSAGGSGGRRGGGGGRRGGGRRGDAPKKPVPKPIKHNNP